MSLGQAPGVTVNRATRVRWNAFAYVMNQDGFYIRRPFSVLAEGDYAKVENAAKIDGIGWQIKTKNFGFQFWDAEANASSPEGVFDSSSGAVASMLAKYYMSENSGVTAGAYHLKSKSATGAWSDGALSADASAYPGPTGAVVAMSRVYAGSSNHDPNAALSFSFWVHGSTAGKRASVAQFYFPGPAGLTKDLDGLGQYCLRMFGDGLADLYERGALAGGSTGWFLRHSFRYAAEVAQNSLQTINVFTNAAEVDGSWKGTNITFATSEPIGDGNRLTETLTSAAITAIRRQSGLSALTEVFTALNAANRPISLVPVRLDVRTIGRAAVTGATARYQESATIRDGVFRLPFFPTAGTDFQVDVIVSRPTGTDADVKFYWIDENGDRTEITASSTPFDDEVGISKIYPVPADGPRDYQVEVTLQSSSDRKKTPTLTEIVVLRPEVLELPEYDEVELPESSSGMPTAFVESVSITGADEKLNSESAVIGIADLTAITNLESRSGVPVSVEMVDATTGDLLSVMHRGYVVRSGPYSYVKGDDGKGSASYPKNGSLRGQVMLSGEWERASRHICNTQVSLTDPDERSLPMLVTSALDLCFRRMGYPSEMVELPTSTLRLFGEGGGQVAIEGGTRWSDTVENLTRTYFSGFWTFDANAGSRGVWRLIKKKIAPYTPLMRFYQSHPGSGKLAHVLGAYATTTSGSQTVVPNYINGNLDWWWEPPEGNQVVVLGSTGGASTRTRFNLSQTLFNPASANFFNLASSHDFYPVPTSPNFLGEVVPIYVYHHIVANADPDGAMNFINWIARRVFDVACFARKYMTFTAPYRTVLEASDTLAARPRPLRAGDIVEVETFAGGTFEKWIVVRCSPDYRDDNNQMARYELVRPENIEEYGIPVGPWDRYALEMRRHGRAKAEMGVHPKTSMFFAGQKAASVSGVPLDQLPSHPSQPIQVIDPDDPDFGKFIPMADYE